MMSLVAETPKINFIPCIKWVKRGVAKANPEKIQLTKEELKQVIEQTKSKLRTDSTGEEEGNTSLATNDDDEYNLDKYDEEAGISEEQFGITSLATIPAEEEEEDGNSDSDSEKEDDIIKPEDNLILVGHVEGDASLLEVYIYNENEGSLYVHHDLLLPSFPLCMEWLDHEAGQNTPGNYCAVGSMSPVIEVWDIDIVNCLEPAFTLGQQGSRRKRIPRIGHADAVLDLAWNKNYHHILSSASVDKTVILWDLDAGQPHTTLKAFKDKVQCVKWHNFEAQTLLAGSCDKTAKVFDCRGDNSFQSWDLDGEAERIIWDPMEPFSFLVATSVGSVQCFDCRKGLLWNLEAHEKEVTGLEISKQCKGLMVTSSSDGTLKIWDHSYNNIPTLVHTKELKMGTVHCLEYCPDLPFVMATGGDNKENNLKVLDLRTIDPVNHTFGSRPLVQLVSETNTNCDVEMENLSINN